MRRQSLHEELLEKARELSEHAADKHLATSTVYQLVKRDVLLILSQSLGRSPSAFQFKFSNAIGEDLLISMAHSPELT